LPVQHDRRDPFARLIVEHHVGSQEIWSTLIAAAQVDPVTRTTVDAVQAVAACDERRITRRALLRGKRRASAASAPAATLRLRSASPCRRLNRGGEHEQCGGGEVDVRTHRDTSVVIDSGERRRVAAM
jgi:hypothetical protein